MNAQTIAVGTPVLVTAPSFTPSGYTTYTATVRYARMVNDGRGNERLVYGVADRYRVTRAVTPGMVTVL